MIDPSKELTPDIRHDIRLLETSPAEDGSKQWLIFDPVQNRYFTIGIDAFELLHHWVGKTSLEEFTQILEKESYNTDIEALQTFINFLDANGLVKSSSNSDAKKLEYRKQQSKQTLFKWLIHNYLFIKIPLFKPDKWLERHQQKVAFMYTDVWKYTIIFLGIYGMMNVFREWEYFINTFSYFFSWDGFAYYIVSLIMVKSLHELGHAFTAKKYGCKIPSTGVALLVMMPVLYTDTTNAYQIKSKHKRLLIALAGIKVEIYLAMVSLFLWSYLDEGALKSIAFTTATTSLIATLLINTSPFLRFDGYYALSDLTDTKNLQPRSFALTRWTLRKYLVGIQEEPPEMLFGKKKIFFLLYAFGTWVYRLFLFLGIAFLIYYFAFKVLGIILFVVEILWFIVLPIFNELKVWWQKRGLMRLNGYSASFILFLSTLIFILFYPWYHRIHLPAVITPLDYVEIYPFKNAKVEKNLVKNNQTVRKGEILFRLSSSQIDYKIEQSKKELASLHENLRLIAGNERVLNNRFILQNSIQKTKNELMGLYETKKSLLVVAPFDGEVHFEHEVFEGQYVNNKESLVTLYNPKTLSIVAYCEEREIASIAKGDHAVFIANNGETDNIESSVDTVSNVSSSIVVYPELSSVYNGPIATRQSSQGERKELVSENAYFKIIASVGSDKFYFKFRTVGDLAVHGKGMSFAEKMYLKMIVFLEKENSF